MCCFRVDVPYPQTGKKCVSAVTTLLQDAESLPFATAAIINHHEEELRLIWLQGGDDLGREAILCILRKTVNVLDRSQGTCSLGIRGTLARHNDEMLEILVGTILRTGLLAGCLIQVRAWTATQQLTREGCDQFTEPHFLSC